MNKFGASKLLATIALSLVILGGSAPAGLCQHAAALRGPDANSVELNALSPKDLKDAIAHAVTQGDMNEKDGKVLIDKIEDIETLMDQFEFIQSQRQMLIGSYGSVMH